MILLTFLESVSLKRLNTIFSSFPEKLSNQIGLIYCLTNPVSFRKVNYKSLHHKTIIFLPNEKKYVNGLINNLQKSQVLVHTAFINKSILEILQSLQDYKIFIKQDENRNLSFIQNKNIFINTSLELNRISIITSTPIKVIRRSNTKRKPSISTFYSRGELKDAIVGSRKCSIIQFDKDSFEVIPQREIIKNLNHRFIRFNHDKLIRKTLTVDGKKIVIIKGVEHLGEVEQTELLDDIKKNASESINYRIIVNGTIPNYLLNSNFHIKRFLNKVQILQNENRTPNQTEFFIETLNQSISDLKFNDRTAEILRYQSDDLFKNLLSMFPDRRSFQSELNRVIKDNDLKNKKVISLTDIMFWYDLVQYQNTQKIKSDNSGILIQAEKKISSRKIKATPKKNKKSKRKKEKLDIRARIQLLREAILKQNKSVSRDIVLKNIADAVVKEKSPIQDNPFSKIVEFHHIGNQWDIYVDGDRAGDIEYDSIAVHMVRELNEKYNNPKKRIDLEELDRILYQKLPRKKNFSEKKKNRIEQKHKSKKINNVQYKDQIKTLKNRLTERIRTLFTNYTKLTCLKGHFKFPKDGAYFDSKGILQIIFTKE